MKALALLTIGLLLASAPRVAAGDEVVVACPRELQPALGRWIAFRQRQGLRVSIVERVDQAPSLSPLGGEPHGARTVVLVGDGGAVGPPMARAPARAVHRYGPEQSIATDALLAAPAAPVTVGRLPFTDARSLGEYLDRVIQRETRPANWGDTRLQIAAGAGGFGPLADAAIEGAARRVLIELAPSASELSFQRIDGAAPAVPRPNDNGQPPRRGGVWVWLGHGLRDRLPGVNPADLARLTGGADIAVLLACYAGDTAAPGLGVVEQLLSASEGPLAVVASTGVSMPYGNARLGAALLAGCEGARQPSAGRWLADARAATLAPAGTPLLQGLDSLARLLGPGDATLDDERQDHARLYQLMGDPLLAIGRAAPMESVAEPRVAPGGAVTVRGRAPIRGRLRLTVKRASRPDLPAVARVEQPVAAGQRFELAAPLEDLVRRGELIARLGVEGPDGLAVASHRVRVEAAPRTASTGVATAR
ncbi:C25 family cysteine peptidase [Botrimarina sp.]|uniref:C25 family cysteine peptidase n=1 Tax=Botrimarina sp. TaxID=2795802 RepID=UPI0032F090B3